jgi:hypothetical protein
MPANDIVEGGHAMKKQPALDRGAIKDPEQWTTGDEPMTGAQDSYIHTLAREAGEEIPEEMTKAEASEKIEELQEKTGRGTQTAQPRRKTRKKS